MQRAPRVLLAVVALGLVSLGVVHVALERRSRARGPARGGAGWREWPHAAGGPRPVAAPQRPARSQAACSAGRVSAAWLSSCPNAARPPRLTMLDR